MTVRFMGDTSYAALEIEMQKPPGFRPRQSGMIVSRIPCDAQGWGCRLCASKSRKNKASEVVNGHNCPREGRVAGYVPFSELIGLFTAEVGTKPFVARVTRLSGEPPYFFFVAGHRERFNSLWPKRCNAVDEDAMCAALYLLSADRFLWGRSAAAVQPDMIRFKEIGIHGVDLGGYVLFHTARDLYQGTKHISLSELTDPELVSDETFRLLIAAFLIRRYGADVLEEERSWR